MTRDEFIKELEKKGRVDFDGSRLTAPSPEFLNLLNPIITSVSLALPDREMVIHGVQSSRPKETLIWILSLSSHVLVLTAKVKSEGRQRRLHLIHDFHHKNRVKTNLQIKCAAADIAVFQQAHLSLKCDSATINISDDPELPLTPEALCRFAASILG